MDYTFITVRVGDEGRRWEGERIHAGSWDEAQEKALSLGVDVCGILSDEHVFYTV